MCMSGIVSNKHILPFDMVAILDCPEMNGVLFLLGYVWDSYVCSWHFRSRGSLFWIMNDLTFFFPHCVSVSTSRYIFAYSSIIWLTWTLKSVVEGSLLGDDWSILVYTHEFSSFFSIIKSLRFTNHFTSLIFSLVRTIFGMFYQFVYWCFRSSVIQKKFFFFFAAWEKYMIGRRIRSFIIWTIFFINGTKYWPLRKCIWNLCWRLKTSTASKKFIIFFPVGVTSDFTKKCLWGESMVADCLYGIHK